MVKATAEVQQSGRAGVHGYGDKERILCLRFRSNDSPNAEVSILQDEAPAECSAALCKSTFS